MGFRSTIRAVDLQAIRAIVDSRDEGEVERVMARQRAEDAEDEEFRAEEDLEDWEKEELEERKEYNRELEEATRGLILRNDPS
ncbi:MAG TPA: hypothetical protein VFT74_06565, partial [Isosphaeraceae bacterium]|nr:hypothetical protein [Isosphaeraceae bacterium]